MARASLAVGGVSAFHQLNQPADLLPSSTFGSKVTSAFLKRTNAPLCCAQSALSITSSIENNKIEDVDLAWNPYLGEVNIKEKAEDPPQYVPPPPIPADDICIRDKVESLLYTLKSILPGQLDYDKAEVLCSMLSALVEVQNPVCCFRGSSKCFEWLKALIQMQASVNLHELYYENVVEDPGMSRSVGFTQCGR